MGSQLVSVVNWRMVIVGTSPRDRVVFLESKKFACIFRLEISWKKLGRLEIFWIQRQIDINFQLQVNEIFTPETVRMSLHRIVGLADEMVLRSLFRGTNSLLAWSLCLDIYGHQNWEGMTGPKKNTPKIPQGVFGCLRFRRWLRTNPRPPVPPQGNRPKRRYKTTAVLSYFLKKRAGSCSMVLRVYFFFFEFWKPFEGFCWFFLGEFQKGESGGWFRICMLFGVLGGQVGADLLWTKMPKAKRYLIIHASARTIQWKGLNLYCRCVWVLKMTPGHWGVRILRVGLTI